MGEETLKFDSTKMVTTWWDVVDHYLLAVMFAVSLSLVGLQTTQDRLICIPAVNCSNFERNDSVVRKWGELSNMLDICNRSPSYVVLTKMPDRRQYDYIDNECYKKIHWFSAYYSLIFLVEAVILLAISNFWQKCPDIVNALAHCKELLYEMISGDFKDDENATARPGEGGEQGRYDREEQETELAQFEHLPPEMTSGEFADYENATVRPGEGGEEGRYDREEQETELAQFEHLPPEMTSGELEDYEKATVRAGERGEQGKYDREEQETELAQFQNLLREMTSEEFEDYENATVRPGEGGEQGRYDRQEQEIEKKLKEFKDHYGQKIIKFSLSSLTWQYRLRGVVGSIFAIAFLAFNVGCYFHSTGLTQCHLNGRIAFSTGHRFFQCTRSKGTYFYISLIVLTAFLFSHLVFVFGSFLWSVTKARRGPEYNLPRFRSGEIIHETFHGDAALLFHFIDVSKLSIFIRYGQKRSKEENRMREGQ